MELRITTTKAMTISIVFLAIFAIHLMAQFISWSAYGHAQYANYLWSVLAFPLLYLLSYFVDQYFWAVILLNSLVWAITITFVIARIARMY
jgi:hypothetical protein